MTNNLTDQFYIYKVPDADEIYFLESEIDKISQSLYQYLLSEMKNYYCDGCRYCCYGSGSQEQCERRFNEDSELPEYLEMMMNMGRPIRVEIQKVIYSKLKSGGYRRDLDTVWCINEYTGYTEYNKDPRIKI